MISADDIPLSSLPILQSTQPVTEITSTVVESRGIWIDNSSLMRDLKLSTPPVDSQKVVDNIAVRISTANFNQVFLETMNNGYSIFVSTQIKQWAELEGTDYLTTFIDEFHKQGIEVHAWLWVFMMGTRDKGGLLKTHPDWVMVDKTGNPQSKPHYWACPSRQDVRDYLISLYREIITKYDIDGLHLDYLRYPEDKEPYYCYCDNCVYEFKNKYGINPREISPEDTVNWTKWCQWREELITSFVKRVRDEVLPLRPGIQLSAAVAGAYLYEITMNYRQQKWMKWIDRQYLDFVTPMTYDSITSSFRNNVKQLSGMVDNRTFMYPGIGFYAYPNDTQKLVDQILATRELGLYGQTLFAYYYLTDEHISALNTGPYKVKAVTLHSNPLLTAGKVVSLEIIPALGLMYEDSISVNDKSVISTAIEGFESIGSWLTRYDAVLDIDDISNKIEDTAAPLFNVLIDTSSVSVDNKIRDNINKLDVILKYAKFNRKITDVPGKIIDWGIVPECYTVYTSTPPVIDGIPNDDTWKGLTPAASGFKLNLGDGTPSNDTLVYTVYNDTALYFLFNCIEDDISNLKTTAMERDSMVFFDDSIELFVDTTTTRRQYIHLVMNSIGTKFDQQNMNGAESFNGQWSVRCSTSTGSWYAEVIIPYTDLGLSATPTAGRRVAINFARSRYVRNKDKGTDEYSAWSCPYGSFHNPKRFGTLVFK